MKVKWKLELMEMIILIIPKYAFAEQFLNQSLILGLDDCYSISELFNLLN
jgi:hypothetical protein